MSGHRFNFIVILLELWKKKQVLIFSNTLIYQIFIYSFLLFISLLTIIDIVLCYIIFYSVCCLVLKRSCFSSYSYLETFSCFRTFLKSSWNIKIEHLWQICFEHISHFRIQGDLVVCGISLLISWWMGRKATKCTRYSTSSEDRWSQINSIPNQFLIC